MMNLTGFFFVFNITLIQHLCCKTHDKVVLWQCEIESEV